MRLCSRSVKGSRSRSGSVGSVWSCVSGWASGWGCFFLKEPEGMKQRAMIAMRFTRGISKRKIQSQLRPVSRRRLMMKMRKRAARKMLKKRSKPLKSSSNSSSASSSSGTNNPRTKTETRAMRYSSLLALVRGSRKWRSFCMVGKKWRPSGPPLFCFFVVISRL